MRVIRKSSLILVQAVTLSRVIAALAFISIALIDTYRNLATIIFLYACITDFLDGFLARRLSCQTSTGGTLDLFGDKFLTIISLLFAIAMGMPILPCSVAILREVFLLSVRSIRLDGQPLFPPQRVLGTLMIIPIWSGTVLLLQHKEFFLIDIRYLRYFYWIIGVMALINLIYKTVQNWKRLLLSFKE